MTLRLIAIVLVLAASAPAFAQHDHAHEDTHTDAGHGSAIAAGVSLVAASFDTMLYGGNYEGIVPSVRWSNERFAAIATGAAYRMYKNGAQSYGLGDVALHGQATLVGGAHNFDAGVLAGVSAPTGDDRKGMGMGHVMVMPGVYASWMPHERLRFGTSVGYSRSFGAQGHHDHGSWPLVSPMLMAEVSWNAGGDVRVTPDVTAGARATGGLPAGEGGHARAAVAGRVGLRRGRVDSAFELQAGLVGDPFTVRGVVSTMVSF